MTSEGFLKRSTIDEAVPTNLIETLAVSQITTDTDTANTSGVKIQQKETVIKTQKKVPNNILNKPEAHQATGNQQPNDKSVETKPVVDGKSYSKKNNAKVEPFRITSDKDSHVEIKPQKTATSNVEKDKKTSLYDVNDYLLRKVNQYSDGNIIKSLTSIVIREHEASDIDLYAKWNLDHLPSNIKLKSLSVLNESVHRIIYGPNTGLTKEYSPANQVTDAKVNGKNYPVTDRLSDLLNSDAGTNLLETNHLSDVRSTEAIVEHASQPLPPETIAPQSNDDIFAKEDKRSDKDSHEFDLSSNIFITSSNNNDNQFSPATHNDSTRIEERERLTDKLIDNEPNQTEPGSHSNSRSESISKPGNRNKQEDVNNGSIISVPSTIIKKIEDMVSIIDNVDNGRIKVSGKNSLIEKTKHEPQSSNSDVNKTLSTDSDANPARNFESKSKSRSKTNSNAEITKDIDRQLAAHNLSDDTEYGKNMHKAFVDIESIDDMVEFYQQWILLPVSTIEQQLSELLDTRKSIKHLCASLTIEQFVTLLKKIRGKDYNQLISFASIVVDLLADANKKRQIGKSDFYKNRANSLISDKTQRSLLLHYLILTFWVLPQQKFDYPACVFAACQFLSNELDFLLDYKIGLEPETEPEIQIGTEIETKTQNAAPAKIDSETEINASDANDKGSSQSLIKISNKQHSISELQQRVWQQRLLGALAVWSSRRHFSNTSNSGSHPNITNVDSVDNNQHQPYRLLLQFIPDDKSLLQLLKQTCLTDNVVNRQQVSNVCNINTLDSANKQIRNNQQIKHTEQVNRVLNEPFLVENSGLVLLSPYFERLLQTFSWISNGKFVDDTSAEKAVILMSYLGTGQRQSVEIDLGLCKVLCGLPLDTFIRTDLKLEEEIYTTADSLLNAVINHWRALGSTSADGLRGSFILRNGWLQQEQERWLLSVENKAFDMLLDQLPWSFRIIKHAWMPLPLSTEWRNNS